MAFHLQAGPTYSFKAITSKKSLASNAPGSTHEGLEVKVSVAQEARMNLPSDEKNHSEACVDQAEEKCQRGIFVQNAGFNHWDRLQGLFCDPSSPENG